MSEKGGSEIASEPTLPAADAAETDGAGSAETLATVHDRGAAGVGAAGEDLFDLAPVEKSSYSFGEEIARGGMGRIVFAHDRRAGRAVAIKEVPPDLLEVQTQEERRGLLRRFEREARVTARLQHPSIVPVYEIGRFGDTPFFAMKMVSGRPLDEEIARTRSLKERLALVRNVISVAEAMAYAHERHVIHRDLKPANVLVGSFGETVVIDWGLAKDLGASEPADEPGARASPSQPPLRTVAGEVFGTPQYMPPEQARGEPVDERADVYAIGAILYHVLACRPPYRPRRGADSPVIDVLAQLRDGPPAPVKEQEPGVPRELASIVARAMARDPSDRYLSAAGLARDLRQFEAGALVEVHDYTVGERIRRWALQNRVLATGSVAAMILAAVALAFLVEVGRQRDAAVVQRILAEERLAGAISTLTERGREDLFSGQSPRAIDSLVRAYRLATEAGRDEPELDGYVDEAMRRLEPLVATFDAGHRPIAIHFGDRERLLLVANERGGAHVWEVASERRVREIDHEGPLFEADLSPSGRYALTLGDRRLRVWNVDDGSYLEVAADGIGSFFSADEQRIALLTPSALEIRDRASGAILHSTELGADPHQYIRSSLRSHLMIVGSSQNAFAPVSTVESFEVWQARRISSLPVAAPPFHIAPSADGMRFAVKAGGRQAIIGALSGRPIWEAEAAPGYLHIDSSGTALMAIDHDRVSVFDSERSAQERFYRRLPQAIGSSRFSPDGSQVALETFGREVLVFDGRSGRLTSTLASGERIGAWLYSPSGDLLVTASHGGTVRVWSARQATAARVFERDEGGGGPRFVDGGTRLVTIGSSGGLLRRVDDGELLAELEVLDEPPYGLAVSADGSQVLIGTSLFEARGGELVARLAEPLTHPLAVALGPDGILAAAGTAKGRLVIWDTRSGKEVHVLRDGLPGVLSLAFSPDGRSLVAGEAPGTSIWDLESGALRSQVQSARSSKLVAFSPDGARVVAFAYPDLLLADAATGELIEAFFMAATEFRFDPTPGSSLLYVYSTAQRAERSVAFGIRTLDTRTGEEVEHPFHDLVDVTRLDFATTPRGRAAAIGTRDGQVAVVDERMRPVWATFASGSPPHSVALSPDASHVVVSTREGVQLWNLQGRRRPPDEVERLVEKGRIMPPGPASYPEAPSPGRDRRE